MFGRENLSIRWVANGYECGNLDRNQAGEVMNRMERRIKRQSNVIKKLHEVLDGNWEHWQKANAKLEQKFTIINAEQNKRIKELENDLYTPCGDTTKLLDRINNFNTEDKRAQKLIEDCYKCIQSLLSQQPKWISVEESLPEDSYMAWVIVENHNKPYQAFYDEEAWFYKETIAHNWNITHWMYCKDWLPPPPSTEKSTTTKKDS